MKTTYLVRDRESGIFAAAIADIVRMPIDSTRREYYVITRINVMERYRGQRYGREILDLILEDADKEGVVLFLEPSASGGLSQEDLVHWYERHGFTYGAWHMRRLPQTKEQDDKSRMTNLYDVKTRREYTEEYKAKWKSQDYETIYPQWGETWGEVRARIEERNKPGKYPGFDKMYRDKLISVVRVSDEDLAARRAAARRYKLCCDKAILRNCVCSYSITCPEHGVKCHGTHD